MSNRRLRSGRSSAAGLFLPLLGLAALGCSGGSDPTRPTPEPSALTAVAGTSLQSAAVGTAVPTAPAVRLLSTAGEPMADVTVAFSVTAGGGSIATASARTDAAGVASPGTWTLGTVAGANELTATAGSLTARLTATAVPGPVAAITLVSGGDQSGSTSAPLPAPVVVRATDAHGNRVPNAMLTFAAATGGGTAQPAQATTNASGEAQTTWTLGEPGGAQTLSATVATVTTVVTAQAEVPFLLATQLTVGYLTQCALVPDRAARCWGANIGGTVGDGTNSFRPQPVSIDLPGAAIQAVSLGNSTGCVLTSGWDAYCWGDGAIGDGSFAQPRWSPVPVAGGHEFRKIVAGFSSVCALDGEGRAWCWGGGPDGGLVRKVPALVSPTLRFVDVAVGLETRGLNDHACGVTEQSVTYCWGTRGIGDPVDHLVDPAYAPKALGGDVALSGGLASGRNHRCGLDDAGAAYCWGDNTHGQLGIGSAGGSHATPQPVLGGHSFRSLTAGMFHTCGLDTGGTVYCWGGQGSGALGNGVAAEGTVPTPQVVAMPAGAEPFSAVAAGGLTTCALASTSGKVYCWGARSTGSAVATADVTPVPVRGR